MSVGLCTACFGHHDVTELRPGDPAAIAALAATGLRWRGLRLCQYCRDELDELRLSRRRGPRVGSVGQLTSLYGYDGVIRRLVLRTKVDGDRAALTLLIALTILWSGGPGLVTWADAVVPAPSSLWGRLRGRLDLAFHIAVALAHRGERPLLLAPFHLHWRPQKQAMLGREARGDGETLPAWLLRWSDGRFERAAAPAGTILLIDDVVTFGGTLRRLAAATAGPAASAAGPAAAGRRIRALSLAARSSP